MLFIFDIFNNFASKLAVVQKNSNFSAMMAPMILIVFLLDSSGYREAMNIRTNCFEVKTEEEWTLKNRFSVKLSNLRNILS